MSSGGLQVNVAEISIWEEIPACALKLERQQTDPLVCKKKGDNAVLQGKDRWKAMCIHNRRIPEDTPVTKIIRQCRAVRPGRVTRVSNPNYQLAETMT